MKLALRHAQHAYREREVPIGAVVVNEDTGEIISAGRNQVEELQDATAHAEIIALRRASKVVNNWRLSNCTLYTTLEPCSMCFATAQAFRIKRVVFAAKDVRLGACGTWINMSDQAHPYHPSIQITQGVLEEESAVLLKRFFQTLRQDKKLHGGVGDPPDKRTNSTVSDTAKEDIGKRLYTIEEESMCGRGYTDHYS